MLKEIEIALCNIMDRTAMVANAFAAAKIPAGPLSDAALMMLIISRLRMEGSEDENIKRMFQTNIQTLLEIPIENP